MNAYQTRTAPSYGHDSTYSSFQGTGAPIFGYDSSANYITPISLEIRPRSVAKFLQFTGKERDAESGLDYFGARYYGSALGRFTSPDDGSDQDSGNPQSWNLYAYGRNSPLNGTDPSGRDWQVCESNGSNCATVTNDAAFDKFNKDTGNYVQGGNYYDSDGNQIGSASWSAPNTDLAGATMIGRTSVVANDIALGFGVMSAGLGGGVAFGALAGGEAVLGLGLQGAARAAALSLPGGAKLAQMISRGGGEFAQNPSGFLSSMRDFVVNAVQEGTYAAANQIGGAGATIYKSGNDYLVVANSGKILSYVPNATPGVGIVTAYYQAGGR